MSEKGKQRLSNDFAPSCQATLARTPTQSGGYAGPQRSRRSNESLFSSVIRAVRPLQRGALPTAVLPCWCRMPETHVHHLPLSPTARAEDRRIRGGEGGKSRVTMEHVLGALDFAP